jgi:hypothetical protein
MQRQAIEEMGRGMLVLRGVPQAKLRNSGRALHLFVEPLPTLCPQHSYVIWRGEDDSIDGAGGIILFVRHNLIEELCVHTFLEEQEKI